MPLVLRWIFLCLCCQEWYMNVVRISKQVNQDTLSSDFLRKYSLPDCTLVNFTFTGMSYQKDIFVSKLWVINEKSVYIKEIPQFCVVHFLPVQKATCWFHMLFNVGVYMEGVLYKCPKLWKICQSLQEPDFGSSDVMALFVFSLCRSPAESFYWVDDQSWSRASLGRETIMVELVSC